MRSIRTEVRVPQGLLRFGIARRDITPPEGIYNRWWGAASSDRATGVHRPLTLTAVLMGPIDGDRSRGQVTVAFDLCTVGWPEQQQILRAITERTGLTDSVMCVYSHTHACPVVDLARVGLPGGDLIPAYLDHIAAAAADAVAEACETPVMASIVVGEGSCALAANRDFEAPGEDGFVCGFAPEGEADRTLLIARVDGLDGRALATILNYACHATTLGWENSLISPDFPGVARQLIEDTTGVPCVFLQGASGDIGPREGFVADVAVVERNGRQLGYAALAAIEALPRAGVTYMYQTAVTSGTRLGVWGYEPLSRAETAQASAWRIDRWTIDLPYRPDLPSLSTLHTDLDASKRAESRARWVADEVAAQDARAHAERATRALARRAALPPGDTFPFPIVAWQTGGVRWLAVEAEPYNHLQREVRRRLPDTPVFVLTLMNGGRVAYLPTAETYGRGIYEEQIAILAPGSLERLIDEAVAGIRQWQPIGIGPEAAP